LGEDREINTYVFDLDGTLCTLTDGDYKSALPYPERIEIVNQLFKEGHEIVIFTARGMRSENGNSMSAKEKWELVTIEQLELWGIKHHRLILGKPAGDFYIDDKGVTDGDFFGI
jgi:phosphoserine phosphatase